VATLAALEAGADHITACDMEQGHVDILASRCPEHLRKKLTCIVGAMPNVDLPEASFDAIVSARMLHFLNPDEFRTALKKIRSWLKPGGKAFLITDTCFTGPWRRRLEAYREKKAKGDEWPGFIEDYGAVFSPDMDMTGHPSYINMMDPDILKRECQRADLIVERASFIDESGADPLDSGDEGMHAAVICRRPD
jgi:SAM-dependent methyltransferase